MSAIFAKREVLHIDEKGHDFLTQPTDAIPNTRGLSEADPSEVVSWRRGDPEELPDTVVAYIDSRIGIRILTS
jgi:deoxyhypusine synthase